MKKNILDRYEQSKDGHIIIDVAARRVEDLYEDFDKTAPYHKKDLDEDLVAYLTACVREIGRSDFVLRFKFERTPSEEFKQRVRTSINIFFMYQRELQLGAMKKMLRTTVTLLMIGIVILGISLWVNNLVAGARKASLLNSVFAEGLTIVAWVSIWEGLATFLLNWAPLLFHIRLYRKIAEAQVLFYQPSGTFAGSMAGRQ